MVTRLDPILGVESLREICGRWTKVRFERDLWLPLRGDRNAVRGVAQRGKVWAVGSNEERDPFKARLVVVELPGQGRAIRIVPAAQQNIGLGGDDLVDDGTEIGCFRAVCLVKRRPQSCFADLLTGGLQH